MVLLYLGQGSNMAYFIVKPGLILYQLQEGIIYKSNIVDFHAYTYSNSGKE